MKKKNIDKKVALSIGGLSVLCLGLLFGAWYLSHEPEESFTPAAQEVETLAETWDDKLDSGIPEASIKEESLYTGEVSDNTQTVISEDENGSNVDLSVQQLLPLLLLLLHCYPFDCNSFALISHNNM